MFLAKQEIRYNDSYFVLPLEADEEGKEEEQKKKEDCLIQTKDGCRCSDKGQKS